MFISKSLFVDFVDFPKLAWWKYHNKEVYNKIKWLDDPDNVDNLIELWETIEKIAWKYLSDEWEIKIYNAFDDNPCKNDLNEDDEEDCIVEEKFRDKLERNIKNTLKAIKNKEKIIYQPWFLIDWLYVIWDYLVFNIDKWTYDLYEVKAKTNIRKDKTFQWVKTKWAWELDTRFYYDIAFQKYVINKVLEKEKLKPINNFYFIYLDWEYKKRWEINIYQILKIDQVDIKSTVIIEWKEKETKEIERNDILKIDLIENYIKEIKMNIEKDEKSFNTYYPFFLKRYKEYYWEEWEFWTIFWKGLRYTNILKMFYDDKKYYLDDLANKDLENLFSTNPLTFHTSVWKYIYYYLKSKKENKDLIDTAKIKENFNKLKYPICFYDYETLCIPIPIFENTSPYQHVVVQYSLHKVYKDWTIKHYSWILAWKWEKQIKEVTIENNKNKVNFENEKIIIWEYNDLLEAFIEDIWEDINSSFIVWYDNFENTRNKEIAEDYPHLRESFLKINENTFDLMDIFSNYYYYSLKFKGSSSIKYVLPALVPEMSYDDMNVPNWLVAMKELNNIISWKINWKEKEEKLKDLLLYCGQDSLAMYKIFEVLNNKI